MEFNFKDYKLFCSVMNFKASHYESLLEFKKFIKILSDNK